SKKRSAKYAIPGRRTAPRALELKSAAAKLNAEGPLANFGTAATEKRSPRSKKRSSISKNGGRFQKNGDRLRKTGMRFQKTELDSKKRSSPFGWARAHARCRRHHASSACSRRSSPIGAWSTPRPRQRRAACIERAPRSRAPRGGGARWRTSAAVG